MYDTEKSRVELKFNFIRKLPEKVLLSALTAGEGKREGGHWAMSKLVVLVFL